MRRIGSLIFVLVALCAAASPVVAQKTVDVVQQPTPVRDDGGRVLYSDWDPAIAEYRLVVRGEGDGGETRLPLAPQDEPFDADLGTDTAGRPAAIVSICDRGVGSDGRSGGCDLFVHTLGETRLRAVTNANTPDVETAPTISRAVVGWSWFGDGAYRTIRGGGEEGCQGLVQGGCPIERIPDPDWGVVAAERVRD